MKIQSTILLIISLILVFISAWNVSIFVRLSDASPNYTTDYKFDQACHMSKKYVYIGNILSIIMLGVSIMLMFGVSIIIIKGKNT